MRHFLGRIWRLNDVIVSCGVRHARLGANIISDLRLFLNFICQAHEGISMNLLTFRAPACHLRANIYENGIGGYNLGTYKAWRWAIPEEFWGRLTLISLEFLVSFATLWIGILQGTITAGECVHSDTDSTTAQGWMYKSNFDDIDQAVQMSVDCKMTEMANAAGIVLNPHWLPGKENIVSDCLSREIISFLSSLLWSTSWMKPSPKAPQKTQCAHGGDGLSFVNQSEWQIRYVSSSASTKATGLLAPSAKPCEKASSLPVSSPSSDSAHFAPPWTMWHKPSEPLTIQIHGVTTPGTLRSFYNANIEDIGTTIPVKSDRTHSHQTACENKPHCRSLLLTWRYANC
jgi:hypothetical protein